ncbi:MAG: hypothetical protein QY326_03245 [Bdellovibrionota bacterium]|nr:MAG: hypothetical protein QY326_03245 [Bdellovibrionota bacterium]
MCKDLIKGLEFDLSPGASPLDVDLVLASSSLKAISVYEYKTQTPPFNMSLVQETAVQSVKPKQLGQFFRDALYSNRLTLVGFISLSEAREILKNYEVHGPVFLCKGSYIPPDNALKGDIYIFDKPPTLSTDKSLVSIFFSHDGDPAYLFEAEDS